LVVHDKEMSKYLNEDKKEDLKLYEKIQEYKYLGENKYIVSLLLLEKF
jgi:hypothetical protein